ncbi:MULTISPECIES: alpha/beta fold hydrolase [Comamonas]|uniref:alpha/beta fold hydrolase n=1 Tax=Comamonas TaxID=283 RepID=UPI00211215DF|nr:MULTISPECIES: alpha/beta hydrolase [Comamonas]UUC95668.1 alpha/beta hydrolase [Comamonas sp. C11]WEE79894.1 alpha/beta hydrolase [Comamonas testosteroni]
MTTHTPTQTGQLTDIPPYQPRRQWRSQMLPVRNMHYHLRSWEPEPASGIDPELPVLVLAHGWMDVAASYQFVVDAFSDAFVQGRRIVAHDWRGFGLSRSTEPCDSYYFTDYLADLDMLLEQISPDRPIDLVGHSMGGNISCMFAGARPGRIRRFVNLEGFGMAPTTPDQAPGRLAQWMDQLREQRAGGMGLSPYDSVEAVANRLQKTNRRLPRDKALWLAHHWSAPDDQGRWHILGDAAHKLSNPYLYRVDEALACLTAISAPTLSVEASDDSLGQWHQGRYTLEQYHERIRHIPQCEIARVQDASHMLHHDQPEAVARLIEDFLR